MATLPSGGTSGGGWYVVTIRQTPKMPFTLQVMQKPFPGPPAQVLVDSGPYATQAQAQAALAAKNKSDNLGLTNPLSGFQAIGSFFQRISTPQMLLRIAEVIVGGILLIVGLAKASGLDQKLGGLVRLGAKAVPA